MMVLASRSRGRSRSSGSDRESAELGDVLMGAKEDLGVGVVGDGEVGLGIPGSGISQDMLGSGKMEKKARKRKSTSLVTGDVAEASDDDDEMQTIGCLFKVKKRATKKGKVAEAKVRAESPRDCESDALEEMGDTLATFRKKLRGPKKSNCAGGSGSEIVKDLLDEASVPESEKDDAVGSDRHLEPAEKSGRKTSKCGLIKEEEDKGVPKLHETSGHSSHVNLEDPLSAFVKKSSLCSTKRAWLSSKGTKVVDRSLSSDDEFKHNINKGTDKSTFASNGAVINACSHRSPVDGGSNSYDSTPALGQDLNELFSIERNKEDAGLENGDRLNQGSILTTSLSLTPQNSLEMPGCSDKLLPVTTKNHAVQCEDNDMPLPSSSEILHGALQSSIAKLPDTTQMDESILGASRSIAESDSPSMSTCIMKEAIQTFEGSSSQLSETLNVPSVSKTTSKTHVMGNAPSSTTNQVLAIKSNDVVNCDSVSNQQTELSVSSENDSGENKILAPRATRNIKKPRHGDMAYEGDVDWDIIHEQGLFANTSRINAEKSSRAKDKSYRHVLDEVTVGGPAAVATGLKARAVTAIEKIKFKDVLKRRGGLQEYLECRNFILGCWSKDVKHILPLGGVTDNLFQDKPARLSLIHEIYLFLDSNGYINSGIASECETPKYKSVFHTDLEELNEQQAFVLKTSNLVAKGVADDQVGSLVNVVAVKNDARPVAEKTMMEPDAEGSEGKDILAPGTSTDPSLNMQANEHAVRNMVLDLQPSFSICDREPSKSCDMRSAPVILSLNDRAAPCNFTAKKQECVQKCPPFKYPQSTSCNSDSDVSMKHLCAEHQLQENEEGTIAHENDIGAHSTLLQSLKLSDNAESDSNIRRRIVIIGAGPSGLNAARHLQRQGFSVIVLEARDRIGGRVHTDRSSLSVPVDLGASIITGIEEDVTTERRPDPSALICRQLGLDLTVLNSDCPLYDIVTGHKVPADLDEALEAEYNNILDDMVFLVAQNGEAAMQMSLEDGLEYALRRRRLPQTVSAGMDPDKNNMVSDPGEVDTLVNQSLISGSMHGAAGVPSLSMLSPLERRVMDWHYAHLEYGCAASLKEVSLPYWNQDDAYGGFGGAHCMIKGGFGTVVESLGQGLNIHLNQIVTEIIYNLDEVGGAGDCKQKVRIITSNGSEYIGDAVLITVPLGCLKADTIKFTPALPEWKQSSIRRLGFGVLNKVVLEFSKIFWDDSIDYFGATAEESSRRGQCFMFWNVTKTVGKPVLISLVAGKAARDGQTMSKIDHVNHALKVLRKLFGEASVPDPVASIVTNWGIDPFSRGAYSYVAIGASGEDYDILGKPVGNCLFFAGEATCKEHPDTVGGAMISGLREAVRIIDIFRSGNDYMAEVDAMEVVQKQSDSERIEVRDISKRLEACRLSSVICKNSPDGTYILPTEKALLQDMFFNAKTISGRLHLTKELLRLPVQSLKSFAGTREGLATLNTWILDSLGKNATPLLRHCVRLLVRVSTDLVAVRLSGIGRTVKEKVCMHSSRDIRSVATQLVSMWIEVFRKEKSVNGELKLLRQASASEPSKVRPKDATLGKASLLVNKEASDDKRSLQVHSSDRTHSTSKASSKKPEMRKAKFEQPMDVKLKISSSQKIIHAESKTEDNLEMSEEAAAAFAAAEAARLAARKAAEAYASSEAEASALRELPKIPSFQKFARREHYAQLDEFDLRRKSGGMLGRQDCVSEIDSRNCRVRNWSVDFSAACPNLESSKISGDNFTQHSFSNEIACASNPREQSGENGEIDGRLTKAWVDICTTDTGGVKDSLAIERWQSQAMDAEVIIDRDMLVRDEEDSNKMLMSSSKKHQSQAGGSATSQVAESKSIEGQPRGANFIKQGIVDYVASLLMPLYKTKTIDRESYKMIMKKTATKVMEQCSEKEKVMAVHEFLDSRRKIKIRSFVDRLIESHMTTRQS